MATVRFDPTIKSVSLEAGINHFNCRSTLELCTSLKLLGRALLMKTKQFAVWNTEDEGYWAMYDSVEDAVAAEGESCGVYEGKFRFLGEYKRAVVKIEKPKIKKKKKARKIKPRKKK